MGTTATNEKLGGLRDNNYELVYDLTDFHVNGDSWEGLRMRLGYYMSNSMYDPILMKEIRTPGIQFSVR